VLCRWPLLAIDIGSSRHGGFKGLDIYNQRFYAWFTTISEDAESGPPGLS
jgi:hypothetical protein